MGWQSTGPRFKEIGGCFNSKQILAKAEAKKEAEDKVRKEAAEAEAKKEVEEKERREAADAEAKKEAEEKERREAAACRCRGQEGGRGEGE